MSQTAQTARRAAALLSSLVWAVACSVAAPAPEEVKCETNDDCPPDSVCSADQGGVCVKAVLPPRSIVGLRVEQERKGDHATTFWVDLRAEDRAVWLITAQHPNRYKARKDNRTNEDGVLQNPGLQDMFHLSAWAVGYFDKKAASEGGEKYDPELYVSLLGVSQDSRLGLGSITRPGPNGLAFPPTDPETKEILDEIVDIPWPHHDESDDLGALPVLVALAPPLAEEGMVPNRGVIYRLLRRKPDPQNPDPGARDYTVALSTTNECHRRLDGSVVMLPGPYTFEDGSLTTSLRLDYASPTAEVSTIAPRVASEELVECVAIEGICPSPSACVQDVDDPQMRRCGCESDEHCGSGLACDVERKQCALDLTGRQASAGVPAVIDGDPFRAYLYTYCDDEVEEDRTLDLVIKVTPNADLGLPELSFRAQPEFEAATETFQKITVLDPDRLCLPNWPPAQDLSLPLSGAPARLGDFGTPIADEYKCCDTSCLAESRPPLPPIEACTPEVRSVFSSVFVRPGSSPEDDVDVWEENQCLPLYSSASPEEDADQVPFSRVLEKCSNCSIKLSRGPDEAPLAYNVRIEPTAGSVFRSRVLADVTVDEGATSLDPIALDYRVQIRGRVRPSDGLCESRDEAPGCLIGEGREAQVVAERIRVESEDATILGPYVYRVTTRDRGEFVLPVNPGVYLITAYPAIGSPGAASKLQVLDLRLNSPDVQIRADGVPEAVLDDPLMLVVGRLATVELDKFDKSTVATPIDLGSWARGDSTLQFNGEDLDLNDPATCYSEQSIGCEVRQLSNNSTKVLISQQQYVTFSTRN